MPVDPWNPVQYQRFQQERAQPFFDLVDLIDTTPAPARVIDLGCGTGELTAELHGRLGARDTLGIDSSAAMLEQSRKHTAAGLRFEQRGIDGEWGDDYDVIFSNAALQWLPDHARLLAQLCSRLAPAGQLAVQMPANMDHPSHALAHALAGEAPYRQALAGYVRERTVLAIDQYASLLQQLGFVRQHVRLQVYGHLLSDTAEVVEWTRGTLLTDYQRRLPPELFERFVAEYRRRLLAVLGDQRPYFYPFQRLLFWARVS